MKSLFITIGILFTFSINAHARVLSQAVICKISSNWDLTKTTGLINQLVGVPGGKITVPDAGDPTGSSTIVVGKIVSTTVSPYYTSVSTSGGVGSEGHYNNVCVIVQAP